jgi:hypothetical protein
MGVSGPGAASFGLAQRLAQQTLKIKRPIPQNSGVFGSASGIRPVPFTSLPAGERGRDLLLPFGRAAHFKLPLPKMPEQHLLYLLPGKECYYVRR